MELLGNNNRVFVEVQLAVDSSSLVLVGVGGGGVFDIVVGAGVVQVRLVLQVVIDQFLWINKI